MSGTNHVAIGGGDTGRLPTMLAAHVPAGAPVVMLDYYEGPFQDFEEAVTAGMDWDIASGLAILPPVAGDMIELCAGAGRLTAPFAGASRTLTVIERSPVAVARLRERFGPNPAIRIVEGDLADYRAPAAVDVVALLGLSIHVLPWPIVERAIALAGESLRPGGSFCVNIMADGIADRLAASDDVVRARRYRDRDGVEREMLTTTRFHPSSRILEQYWAVRTPDGVAAARMHSHFWTTDEVGAALALAGFRAADRIETPIAGGAGQGAGVVFLRAERRA